MNMEERLRNYLTNTTLLTEWFIKEQIDLWEEKEILLVLGFNVFLYRIIHFLAGVGVILFLFLKDKPLSLEEQNLWLQTQSANTLKFTANGSEKEIVSQWKNLNRMVTPQSTSSASFDIMKLSPATGTSSLARKLSHL